MISKAYHTNLEEKYYDSRIKENTPNDSSYQNLSDQLMNNAHRYFEEKVLDFINDHSEGGTILDYGCGIGEKSLEYFSSIWKIIGIDISSKSIEIANQNKSKNARYMVINCEKMDLTDNSFDLIFDYGTFSSLDMKKAFPEILRVLKPTGSLIAIETLGHNPFTNIKRRISVILGKRTKWAHEHIMKMSDWNHYKRYFETFEIKYFGLFILFINPLVKIMPSKYQQLIIDYFQTVDDKLLHYDLFKKWAFKTVVVLKNPSNII